MIVAEYGQWRFNFSRLMHEKYQLNISNTYEHMNLYVLMSKKDAVQNLKDIIHCSNRQICSYVLLGTYYGNILRLSVNNAMLILYLYTEKEKYMFSMTIADRDGFLKTLEMLLRRLEEENNV